MRSVRSLLGMATRPAALAAIAVGLCGAPWACGTEAVEGGAVCTYGQEIPCTADAACPGTQECLPDLTGYGPCACAGPGAGRDASPMPPADGGR